MELQEKAKELAQVIKETDEYQELTSAQARVKLDPTAQDLLDELQGLQQDVQEAQGRGEQPQQEQIQRYQTLEQQAQNNLALKNLVKAQQSFGEVMNKVNEAIGDELFQEGRQ